MKKALEAAAVRGENPEVVQGGEEGELAGGNQRPEQSQGPDDSPDWCKCGFCIVMPTQEENKCCRNVVHPCNSQTNVFRQLVLDGNVLEIAMRYREDALVLNNVRNNENFLPCSI